MEYLYSLFLTPDESLSRERVRNEIARGKLIQARLMRQEEEAQHEAAVKALDDELRLKREGYAAAAAPLLAEFDEIASAQHYYSEITNTVTSHEHVVSQLVERELGEFGYTGKKLISIALNHEALRNRIASGAPFAPELETLLKDADSEDLTLIAAPLSRVRAIPPPSSIRATAFDLARAIEEMGHGPTSAQVRGWLDFLKFRTSFSPTMLEMRQVQARKAAAQFLGYIENNEYHLALQFAEDIYAAAKDERLAKRELLDSAFSAFRDTTLPNIAVDIFSKYARTSLDASRFMSVEKMLKE